MVQNVLLIIFEDKVVLLNVDKLEMGERETFLSCTRYLNLPNF